MSPSSFSDDSMLVELLDGDGGDDELNDDFDQHTFRFDETSSSYDYVDYCSEKDREMTIRETNDICEQINRFVVDNSTDEDDVDHLEFKQTNNNPNNNFNNNKTSTDKVSCVVVLK